MAGAAFERLGQKTGNYKETAGHMTEITELEKFTLPLGQQQVDLQEIVHAEGAMPMLRMRIREGKRFTIFDLDPVTTTALAKAMLNWAEAQKS